ncbi:hypothetical protein KDX27_31530 [Burkholderia cenocepacia]|uniref:hypothetical protein n=1 Tax=Burkholderia cenocepacia TaxID=95486 RepID=UPI001B8EF112|nr:hypothetical protein [Burkholderia cenocepacia]MBR8172271.1 hypothetical protein [Burkholderia cenocepacia]
MPMALGLPLMALFMLTVGAITADEHAKLRGVCFLMLVVPRMLASILGSTAFLSAPNPALADIANIFMSDSFVIVVSVISIALCVVIGVFGQPCSRASTRRME